MSTVDKMLKGMMGDKHFEILQKTIYRQDSDSSITPLDMWMPLMVLPRTILSWLVQNIKPMKVNDLKQMKFPGNENITIHVQKTGRDSYRAEFVEDGRVIHTFDKQTLPGIGGHLMTIGEMYDDLGDGEEDDSYPEPDDEPKKTVASTMCDMAQVSQVSPDDSEKFKWAMAHENVKELTGVIGKLVDAFVANHVIKQNVASIVDEPKKDNDEIVGKEEKDPIHHTDGQKNAWKRYKAAQVSGNQREVGISAAHYRAESEKAAGAKQSKYNEHHLGLVNKEEVKETLQKPYVSEAQRKFFHTDTAREAGITEADTKHWDESSKGKKLPEHAAKVEPPGAAASPKMPIQAQGAAPAVKPNKDPIAAQRKQGQAAFKEKFGKLATPKPNANYFKNKLSKPVAKNEYHVSEAELYTPCFHCGVSEFVKSEEGPKYKPCVCFYVTLKSDEGKKISFVQVLKKKEGGYSLKFNTKADPETVETFLKTLRSKLLEQRKK